MALKPPLAVSLEVMDGESSTTEDIGSWACQKFGRYFDPFEDTRAREDRETDSRSNAT